MNYSSNPNKLLPLDPFSTGNYVGQQTSEEKVRMTEYICGSENKGKENNSITVEGKAIGVAINSTPLERKRVSVRVESKP